PRPGGRHRIGAGRGQGLRRPPARPHRRARRSGAGRGGGGTGGAERAGRTGRDVRLPPLLYRHERPGPRRAAPENRGALDGDLDRRRAAGRAVTQALQPGLPVRTFVFNTILADKSMDDRLRRYATWDASRHLGNEIEPATVEALIGAVTSRYRVCQRWYRLKAQLLGLDDLDEHDRYAPLLPDESEIGWGEAKDIVLDAYRSF